MAQGTSLFSKLQLHVQDVTVYRSASDRIQLLEDVEDVDLPVTSYS